MGRKTHWLDLMTRLPTEATFSPHRYLQYYHGGRQYLRERIIIIFSIQMFYTLYKESVIYKKNICLFFSSCRVGEQSEPCTATIPDLCVSIWFLIIPDSSSRALRQWPAETPTSEVGEMWRGNGRWILPTKYLILVGFCNILYKLTTWDWRLYFPSERSRATDFDCP
jgi:hypothetical protein